MQCKNHKHSTKKHSTKDRFVDVLEQLCSERKLVLLAIFEQVTRAGDSLLHEAAYFKTSNLTKTNNKGDTPFHVATRAKTSALTNECGNTPLHEAVKSKHFEGANLLLNADKCVAHYLNKSDDSPLYLAALILYFPFWISTALYMNTKADIVLYIPYTSYSYYLSLIKEIVAKKPDLVYLRDEDGGTPLHYATARGYVDGVRILLNKSSLIALERNTKGHLPIHLACKNGHVKVVEEFLQQQWAYDSRVLINTKGQNALHIAAKNGQ
ncbi:protein ACCELERATED CELL DEATH 6 [Senna tora]|uniref:Protein ACCELERATED CELL DEATH 6 n=1 Tax=Senna tora TaxID=362788 RepID=A0A834TFE1_9FABA|nr:protein ACCELERATED CELL DEATH 6 [Senna tora]